MAIICGIAVYIFDEDAAKYSDPALAIISVILLVSSSYTYSESQQKLQITKTINSEMTKNLSSSIANNYKFIGNQKHMHCTNQNKSKTIGSYWLSYWLFIKRIVHTV